VSSGRSEALITAHSRGPRPFPKAQPHEQTTRPRKLALYDPAGDGLGMHTRNDSSSLSYPHIRRHPTPLPMGDKKSLSGQLPVRYPARTAWNCIASDNKHADHRGRSWNSIWVSHTTGIVPESWVDHPRCWGSRCNPAIDIALGIASALNCSLVPAPNSPQLPDTPRNLAALHISSPILGSSGEASQSNVSSSHVYNPVHQLYDMGRNKKNTKRKKAPAPGDTAPAGESSTSAANRTTGERKESKFFVGLDFGTTYLDTPCLAWR